MTLARRAIRIWKRRSVSDSSKYKKSTYEKTITHLTEIDCTARVEIYLWIDFCKAKMRTYASPLKHVAPTVDPRQGMHHNHVLLSAS